MLPVGHRIAHAPAAIPARIHNAHLQPPHQPHHHALKRQILQQLHRERHACAQHEAACKVLDDGVDAQIVTVPSPVNDVHDRKRLQKRRQQDHHVVQLPVSERARNADDQQRHDHNLERNQQRARQRRYGPTVRPEAIRRRPPQFHDARIVQQEGLHGDVIHHAQVSGEGEVGLPRLLGQGAEAAELGVKSVAVAAAPGHAGEAGFGEAAPYPGAEIGIEVLRTLLLLLRDVIVGLAPVGTARIAGNVRGVTPEHTMGAIHLESSMSQRRFVSALVIFVFVLAVVLVLFRFHSLYKAISRGIVVSVLPAES
mmetsp:Transcript_34526/g.63467  ORF Transcript_34526/g.63467 Transcript_34526/m.63467 type:complete len:311 (-) Transcript_34526:195-1127(-)